MTNFPNQLIFWYLENKRSLPWRTTKDPYRIWLSEILLQQTRVDQGKPYYLRFIKSFPTVFDLAAASEEEVLKLWQGLGYYTRARNLHDTARQIAEKYNGIFPPNYADLIKFKGIGPYTAAAIASICFDQPKAVVDGNVYRVLARVFGVFTPIDSSTGVKDFSQLAQQYIVHKNPGQYNQAIMELGARVCTPKNPDCQNCPINDICIARKKDLIASLPVKSGKKEVRKRYFNYLVVRTKKNETELVKRTKGIWTNLYEFPLIESEKSLGKDTLKSHEIFNKWYSDRAVTLKLSDQKEIVHKLSHQHIYTKFWLVEEPTLRATRISWDRIEEYPVSRLMDKFINHYKNK